LELAVVGLPGRYIFRSIGTKIGEVELQEDMMLPAELAQADLPSHGAGKREIWRSLPDFQGRGNLPYADHSGQQDA
jgi:hypothetical protein